jgi:hypothetical protein
MGISFEGGDSLKMTPCHLLFGFLPDFTPDVIFFYSGPYLGSSFAPLTPPKPPMFKES